MSTLRVDSIRGQTADGTYKYVVQTVLHEYQTYTEIASDSNTDVGGSSLTPHQNFLIVF